jgi:hypothetical protein
VAVVYHVLWRSLTSEHSIPQLPLKATYLVRLCVSLPHRPSFGSTKRLWVLICTNQSSLSGYDSRWSISGHNYLNHTPGVSLDVETVHLAVSGDRRNNPVGWKIVDTPRRQRTGKCATHRARAVDIAVALELARSSSGPTGCASTASGSSRSTPAIAGWRLACANASWKVASSFPSAQSRPSRTSTAPTL